MRSQATSAAARGREFEILIADLLRAAGFEVTLNAKTAHPRQTDLFATIDGIDLLVEAKNRKRKVDVSDIADLRDRLYRTPGDIVGVIISTSAMTREAIKEIETYRTREILVFLSEEIEHLQQGRQSLRVLLERKRKELRVQGKAWFGPVGRSDYTKVALPRAGIDYQIGGTIAPYYESQSNLSDALYVLEIPDSGWSAPSGEGARLTINLALSTITDLRDLLGYIHDKFGLSRSGVFSVNQSETCWHGIGSDNFIQTVERWRQRYAQSRSTNFHNSEVIRYFDRFRDGWIELSSQQTFPSNDSRPAFLYLSELVIQLPGVPVDTTPFVKLCQYVGAEWAHFNYIGQRWTTRSRLKKAIKIDVEGTIVDRTPSSYVEPETEMPVIAVIARNPFFGRKTLPKELKDGEGSVLRELTEIEAFPCSLRNSHSIGDGVDYYILQGFEVTIGGRGRVIRPFGTWNCLSGSPQDREEPVS